MQKIKNFIISPAPWIVLAIYAILITTPLGGYANITIFVVGVVIAAVLLFKILGGLLDAEVTWRRVGEYTVGLVVVFAIVIISMLILPEPPIPSPERCITSRYNQC